MKIIKGRPAGSGIAIGPITELGDSEYSVKSTIISDADEEIKRFARAKEQASDELEKLYEKALEKVGETQAGIFKVHRMMLDDDDYKESIEKIIRKQSVSAEYAIASTRDNFTKIFADMDNEYMRARSDDVRDVSNRIIRLLTHKNAGSHSFATASIIVADDITPSEAVQIDRKNVLAFATRRGSANSHTAILARTMNIPAIVTLPMEKGLNGRLAIVDAQEGLMILDPDDKTVAEYKAKKEKQEKENRLLLEFAGRRAITKSGKEIKIYANISAVEDAAIALENGAEGIGLFRSEFSYLESETYPTEEQLFKAYRFVAEVMAGKKVIIRTLDIGADKQKEYFGLGHEDNPAMGYRAIRICLTRKDVFKTQLRAIYRASAYGSVAVMIPMVISLWEVQEAKKIIDLIKTELDEEGKRYGNVDFGIMIETPAAVMIADELAKEVDFFSIGTNDLTQYTLAIDRQNQALDQFYDAHHPAVIRMIKMVLKSAHDAGIEVGICGELGADITLTETFIKMGIDKLSVSPDIILTLKKKIIDSWA